ncbi:MAG: pyruvate dehydrogenase (acetyl-transferring) E1 component subunit alpha [Planctomycetes bacterium]|nr:pyruvate dehydrogenase (acetyl-transferring) E1 component subunit alpha [Planctomycetota bacterium]
MTTEPVLQAKTAGVPPGEASTGLSLAELKHLYRTMVRTRALDERGMNLQRQGRIAFYVPSTGQEAAHIGSAFALRADDWVFPSYREPGIALLRGAPVRELVLQLYGRDLGRTRGRQMPNHFAFADLHLVSISSPIGTQIVQATGCAMAMRARGRDQVAMTWFGDGATSSNDFHVGLNFAGVYRAPVVFFCQNNGWAITLPVDRQTASTTLAVKAKAYGLPGVRVDGNDVRAVVTAARDAVDRARAGGGPTLIEAVTYRMGPHSTSDDPRRYRTEAECETWARRDPLERLRHDLEGQGAWTQAQEDEVRAAARDEVNTAVAEAEAAPSPDPRDLFEEVYAELPWNLEEQRRGLLRPGGE